MTDAMEWLGRSMRRVEDARLLRGAGRFVDDVDVPGALHVVFVRSPVAHGRIRSIDAGAARAVAGVRAVLTFADLRPLLTGDRIPTALPSGMIRFHVDPTCLAQHEVVFVGEPVAMVVAVSRAIAEDAARLVDLDIEPLPAVTDPVAGVAPGAPRARLDCPDNLVAHTVMKYGDVDAAFAQAAHRFDETFRMHKGLGGSIETRGVIARFDAADDLLTVWANTQMPHRAKALLVAALGLVEHQVRVIAPDVGGGFGPKAVFHPEELAVPAAAILLRCPVKWMEDRAEHFVSAAMERDQFWQMEAAADATGRLLGIRGRLFHDHGHATPYGVALPYNAGTNLVGPYVLPAFHLDISWCLTNMAVVAPTRGAGRPQGTFVMERFLDRIAERVGIPRDEVRRRNLIPAQAMPYTVPIAQRDGRKMLYDSGDYPESQRRALERAGWTGFAARQAAARAEGRWLGLGLANYVEATGRGPFESASIRVGPSGRIVVTTGATAQGQGTASMLVQLAAGVLGVAPEQVHVVDGDTQASPLGLGAFASRQAVNAGNAIVIAAREVADKAKRTAAAMMEVSADDLELRDGCVQLKGVPEMKRSLADIARALGGTPGFALPEGVTPGLAAASDFEPAGLTYNNGTHVVEAEVDIATGGVTLHRYVVVHDCGRMINPMLVEGQVLGAIAHGIGSALYEHMRFDAEGQPQSVTFADYLLPTTDAVPRVEVVHMESPTPMNPLGVKGAAESGTIAAPAAVIAAIEDALRPLGVRISEFPVSPPRLLALIEAARSPS